MLDAVEENVALQAREVQLKLSESADGHVGAEDWHVRSSWTEDTECHLAVAEEIVVSNETMNEYAVRSERLEHLISVQGTVSVSRRRPGGEDPTFVVEQTLSWWAR